ncbi:hypothetical protein TNCV_2145481 [Trichonephila clavipes]|uniref:Uncharacterized protein n=1 Tax=Trichonephila clavipes TaxID=2585209 RepID=A0A8X6SXN1_TRICX|nr:hypothetical protein TNCV_2145481 [Trichonephila clavipes]
MNPSKKEILKQEIDRLLSEGIIEECESPYASPVVLIPKPNGTFRLCIDYRKLNETTVADTYPLPRMDDLLHQAKLTPFMSTLDLRAGYHQSNATEKSNLNNASTREARRKRIKRAHQLAEQIESRNLAQRISTAEGHAQESQEQCNERLQENIIRTRAAGERDIATSNATEKSNLNNASSKGSRRKRVERAQQLPEQIETRNAAQRIRTAESRARESQEQRDERCNRILREQEWHENET